MKTVTILFFLFSISIFAQENQNSKKDLILSLNTKVTIKIDSTKSAENTAYSIVTVEPFEKILEKSDIETFKNSKREQETIVFYLCQEKDKASKYNTLLIRNFSKFAYQFKTEIQNRNSDRKRWEFLKIY